MITLKQDVPPLTEAEAGALAAQDNNAVSDIMWVLRRYKDMNPQALWWETLLLFDALFQQAARAQAGLNADTPWHEQATLKADFQRRRAIA